MHRQTLDGSIGTADDGIGDLMVFQEGSPGLQGGTRHCLGMRDHQISLGFWPRGGHLLRCMEANERGPRGVVELGASQSTGVCGGAVGDGLCLAAIGRRRLSWTEYKQHPDREWHPFGKPAGHLARAPLLAGCKLTEGGCGSSCRLAMWGEDFCFVKKRKIATG